MLLISTYLDSTYSKGIGLFATDFISNGTTIWKFDSAFDREFIIKDFEQINECVFKFIKIYGSHISDEKWHVCLDNARFMNHSDNPNIIFSTDESNDIVGIAIKDINKGEEITANYKDFDIDCSIDLGFKCYD
jgi:hypothetical protein